MKIRNQKAKRHPVYRILKKMMFYEYFNKIEGALKKNIGLKTLGYVVIFKGEQIKICNDQLEVNLRNNTSDFDVFDQIFIKGEYSPVVQYCIDNSIPIETIVDLGANIGFTSLYLSNYFPNAKLISVEADINNFKVLHENLIHKENIELLNSAIWHNNEKLVVNSDFRDGREWSLSVEPDISGRSSENIIEGITMYDIITRFNLSSIDILKIDIEGAERFIFDQSISDINFLDCVKIIVIEIHDEYLIRTQIYSLLKSKNFLIFNSGDITIGVSQNGNVPN
jgi:FkbM family methyltransferase